MLRTALVATILFASAGASRADTLPLLGLPSGYTPGTPISFDVFAPCQTSRVPGLGDNFARGPSQGLHQPFSLAMAAHEVQQHGATMKCEYAN